ncbi:tagatose 1,6-diphosphate aldolase [Acrocarpospora pleiomorpha]|uniref:Tagatose 1,6-diphosphate aldolase n=1 Tax=Acrocarpospora pleiomorpha TaxID=90975 RepID=A0A5M3XYL9_9ACTN|nr:tagatose 1,6-diphosphate aldolase [Acrocarpospora pleiomorpha]GES26090.1 tagatose 1,6-diphosphate aldolase [Acrocarpospora pleiomorpha]
MARHNVDPGKIRGLTSLISADGHFLMSAIDHLGDFSRLLPDVGGTPDFAQIVCAKARIARVLAEESSAILLDPEYGIGHLTASGAVPAGIGLVASIEGDDYEVRHAERHTRLRPGWSPAKARLAGADAAKLLWYYRPDGNPDVRASQLRVLENFLQACDDNGLVSIVEPIWSPLPEENVLDPAWRAGRVRGIIESAIEIDRMGTDVLKVEFPGYLGDERSEKDALRACEELDARTDAPWLILSAGVGYEDFVTQVEISATAGASGYLAGRSLWREAVTASTPADREASLDLVRERLRRLNATVRDNARPFVATHPLDDILGALGPFWYESWHENSDAPSRSGH